MKPIAAVALSLLLSAMFATAPAFAACDNIPWKFGMTPEQVAAIVECGPYKSFSNGDLETYEGVFAGEKENFQFFFQDGKLRRIAVYLYEGQDPAAGAAEWLKLYRTLTGMFAGGVDTRDNAAPESEEAAAAFVATARELVQASGKTQMAPRNQPSDALVFTSFIRSDVGGETYYNVILYFDPQR